MLSRSQTHKYNPSSFVQPTVLNPTLIHHPLDTQTVTMKASFLSIFAAASMFLSVSAAPKGTKQKDVNSAYSIVEDLYTNIQQYTGAISMRQCLRSEF